MRTTSRVRGSERGSEALLGTPRFLLRVSADVHDSPASCAFRRPDAQECATAVAVEPVLVFRNYFGRLAGRKYVSGPPHTGENGPPAQRVLLCPERPSRRAYAADPTSQTTSRPGRWGGSKYDG